MSQRVQTAAMVLLPVLFVPVLLATSSCATQPEIRDAPLAEEGETKLRRALIGSWKHTVTVRESGEREPADQATEIWTFREDGTGRHLRTEEGESERTRSFKWRLEGRNLFVEMKEGADAYFRAETWSPRQMRWHDYRTEEVLLLERDVTREPKSSGERQRRRPDSEPATGDSATGSSALTPER